MEFILIRHGESEANALYDRGIRLITGQWDCRLTPEGVRQASSLKGNPLLSDADACYSSDLIRAQETARCFWTGDIILDARIRERTHGVFDGRTEAEIRADGRYSAYFSDPALMDFRHSFYTRSPGGENYDDVCRRVGDFLRFVSTTGAKKIVIVSHINAIRCMLRELLGLSEAETLATKVPNCSPLVVKRD